MFTHIETNRLVLRSIDHSDRDLMLEELQNDFISRYLFDAEPMTDISQANGAIHRQGLYAGSCGSDHRIRQT